MTALLRAVNNLASNAAQLIGLGSDTTIPKMKYLSREEAAAVDETLLEYFSMDCIMELGGLAVAASLLDAYRFHTRVLIICGPGNNGGWGLAAARYLAHFGYDVTIVYPKRPGEDKAHLQSLARLVELMRIPVMPALTDLWEDSTDVVVDAIFGVSYSGVRSRPPFDMILAKLKETSIPIVSIDVPSGWDIDNGPGEHGSLEPDVLVSLVAPKKCALKFAGQAHYLGGRFVPPAIQEKAGIKHPNFAGAEQFVRLDVLDKTDSDDEVSEDEPEPEYYYF